MVARSTKSLRLVTYLAVVALASPLRADEGPEHSALSFGAKHQGLSAGGVDEIVFALRQPGKDEHWYANFSHYAHSETKTTYGNGGKLCRLELATGKVTALVDDKEGGIRDPVVHYDGRKILFSYRKGGSKFYHLYQINTDGSGLRHLVIEYDFIIIHRSYTQNFNIF